MAIPTHYIKKRDLLHSEKSPAAVLSKTGREFLALERYSDALDFFEKARDMEAISEIKKLALQTGDTFLLARLDRFDRKLLKREEWETAANRAVELGKSSMAQYVARKFAPPAGAVQKAEELPGEAPLAEV